MLDIPADRIVEKSRLQPGRMLLVDTGPGGSSGMRRSKDLCRAPALREWLDKNLVHLL